MDPRAAKVDNEANWLQNQEYNDGLNACKEEENGAENKSLEQELNPMQIGDILKIIFGYLDVKSIKEARQVNPLWSAEGAKVLISKCFVIIPTDIQARDVSRKSKDVEDLKAFLAYKSSDVSMISNITIKAAAEVGLWKSLKVLGPQVSSIKMNFIDGKAELLRNLLELLPGLKYLRLKDMETNVNALMESQSIMKVLTSVMSGGDKNRSPLVISSMVLKLDNENKLLDIEKFVECKNIMIEQLKVYLTSHFFFSTHLQLEARMLNFMDKILSTNQNILKTLILYKCHLFLSLLEFPVMTALDNIQLDFGPKNSGHLSRCKFSPSFRFSEKTPNLQNFTVEYDNRLRGPSDRDFFVHLLANTGQAPSVKYIKFSDDPDDLLDSNIDPLLQTFPNTEELKAATGACSQRERLMYSIWNYGKNIKKLNVNFFKQDHEEFPDLDSIFTGFSHETVDRIKDYPNLQPYSVKKLEQLRVNPSILNLTELMELSISFGGVKGMTKKTLTVASKYGFKLLPKYSEMSISVYATEYGDGHWTVLEVNKFPKETIKFNFRFNKFPKKFDGRLLDDRNFLFFLQK